MKDAVATMGAVLPDDAGGRDAVHVAVISAIAGEKLFPGQDVGFGIPGTIDVQQEQRAKTGVLPLGIVDPFIKGAVMPDQRFWLYLYPRTITGLRHQWTHPAFSDDAGTVYGTPSQRLAAEQWIKDFVVKSDCPGYEELMAAAAQVADNGANNDWDKTYLHFNGSDAHGEIPDEFWLMAEIVLGRPIKGKKPSFFSCSC